MRFRNFFSFLSACFGLTILVFLVFGILQWLQVPTGRFLDWIVSITIFWWLIVIVTVPWNLYFRAKEVLTDAAKSKEKDIPVKVGDVDYVKRLARRSMIIALALHVISALGLYILAATGISAVGYIGAGAALLLTGLRPAIRMHDYIAARLEGISKEIKYPREDIYELRERVRQIEDSTRYLKKQFDLEEPTSWAATQQKKLQAIQEELTQTRVELENLRVYNKSEHDRLQNEAAQAISQLTKDSEFLSHVREIIRFIKSA